MEQREKRLKRVALKCGDFAKQISYHQAFRKYKGSLKLNFWIATFNNAIDLAVLDWFHLFGYQNDDLHWKRVVSDNDKFRDGLFNYLNLSKEGFEAYRNEIKAYRDKDIAHIEIRPVSNVPEMSIALKACNYYNKYVLKELFTFGDYSKWPNDLMEYYQKSLEQAENVLSVAYEATKNINETVF